MGTGGQFHGRAAPAENPNRPIPFVDPQVLEDPRVKQWFSDLKAMALQDDLKGKGGKRNKKGDREVTQPDGPGYSAPGMLERDKRAMRGLSRLHHRAKQGQGTARPGMGPAGPVGSPLWPEQGGSFPVLQSPGAVGSSSQAQQAAPRPEMVNTGFDIPQTDQRLQAVAELLINRGPQGLAPQTLEKMSSTQREVTEGALDALGLNWEDFEDAYAQTRFQNVGNALSA
jgi:hypothetical protein